MIDPTLKNANILIVDDQQANIDVLVGLLEFKGFINIKTTTDSRLAVSLFEELKPDLLLLDLKMPHLNGFQVMEQLKPLIPTDTYFPILILTADITHEAKQLSLSGGATDFLAKPFDLVEVDLRIKNLLKARYLHKQLENQNQILEEKVKERNAELLSEITIRKRNEEQVTKLNRVYAVLSNINEAIVRIHDIQQLFNKACLIAIEEGKFQSAWVGLVNSETNKIETSATAGIANSLIELSPKQNPVINAIKSGKRFFSNNIENDTNIPEIWKRHSLSLGFRSFIVFPLFVHGKVIGGYCIYSGESGFFNDAEVNLLDEMATDISFALEFIQNEAECKRAEAILRENHERYKKSQQIGSIGSWEYDIENDSFWGSGEAKRIYGFNSESENFSAEEVMKCVIERDRVNQALIDLIEKNEPYNIVFDIIPPNSSEKKTIHSIAELSRDKNGNKIKVTGAFQDITERKRAEAELITANKELTFQNDEKEKRAAELTIANTELAFQNEEKKKRASELIIANKELAFQNEEKEKRAAELIIANKELVFENKEKEKRTEELIIAIEKVQRAEEEIAMLAHSLRSVNECVSITDLEDNIQFVNESFLKTYGYDENELVGKHISIVRSQNNPPELVKEILPATISGGWMGELWNKRKDGSVFPIYLSTTRINDNDGKTLGLIGVAKDITERKHSEESLLKLKKAVDNSGEVIFLTDKEGVFTFANSAFTSIYGFTADEIVGKATPRILKGGLEEDNYYKLFWETLKGGKEKRSELVNKKKDGTLINVEISATPIFDEKNNIIGYLGIQRDITARKRAEEEITMLAHSLRSINECVSITDMENKILFVNESFLKTYGYDENELVGKNITIVRSLDKAPELVGEILPATLRGGWKGELRNKRKDGSEFPIYLSTTIINDKDDKSLGLIGVANDITKRKLAEETLKKSEESYRFIVESTNAVIYHLKYSTMKYDYINPAIEKLTGYTPEEINEIGFKNIIVKINRYHVENVNIDLIVANREQGITSEWQADYQVRTKDGRLIWLSDHSYPWLDETGNLIGGIGILEDITERKRIEKELIESKEKAESANKLKDAFINNISHEIRTPLNGIVGLSSLIKESYSQYMVEDDASLFTGIDDSAQRIIRTVDMILNFSRLQSGEFTVIPKQINLFEICELVIKQNREAAEVKSLELLFDNRCNGTKITGDEYTITQIVYNLVENAIKYTKKGTVEIALLPGTDGSVILEIKDTGIGIAEEYLEHLFEPYRQEKMGYGRPYEGVGLGLALTKKFVELNNAVLSVESIKGEGTTFSVKFNGYGESKIDQLKLPERIETIKPSVSKMESKTAILIVEDDKFNKEILKRILDKKYKTHTAESAEEAYEVLKKNEVDLILMDISIQGKKDGLELTKELKATKKYLHIPVIAVTAHAGNEDQWNALTAGCDDYLAKPFSMDQLFKKIEKFVNAGNNL